MRNWGEPNAGLGEASTGAAVSAVVVVVVSRGIFGRLEVDRLRSRAGKEVSSEVLSVVLPDPFLVGGDRRGFGW